MKNAHLLRSPHPSSLRRTFKYASLLRISGFRPPHRLGGAAKSRSLFIATPPLHLGIFDQPPTLLRSRRGVDKEYES